MARRKGRTLSAQDCEVWSKLAKTTTPLRPQPPVAPDFQPKPAPLVQKPIIPQLTRIGAMVQQARVTINLATDPMQAAKAPGNQMDRRRFEQLRKGKIKPDARLDLHGLTADQAHSQLIAFIHRSHGAGKRLALVITGKGNTTHAEEGIMPTRQGILRHSLPHWLDRADLRPLILQITPAHAKHGGGGAYYVYLRRSR
ncbi:MAG: Smr/MutS family protein [Paracoccaceae bacterium]